ncbi:MAG: ABC transporter substrate-binding protein [Firmicutes bacterium]|nr:ABC transporter substrate-binding protein [Bacillota bacterium]
MKKKLLTVVLAIVMALGVGSFFIGCDGAGDEDFLESLRLRIEALELELATQGQGATLREVENLLLKRDLDAAIRELHAVNAQLRFFEGDIDRRTNPTGALLHHAAVAASNAIAWHATINYRVNEFRRELHDVGTVPASWTGAQNTAWNNATNPAHVAFCKDARALRDDLEIATIARNNAVEHQLLMEQQYTALLEERAIIEQRIASLEAQIDGADVETYVAILVNHINRRIVQDGNYLIIPNRHYNAHIAQFPTIAPSGYVRPTRTVRVPFNPATVAVTCPSFLDIMIALELQDRVDGFTFFVQPDFIEEHFPRTQKNEHRDIIGTLATSGHAEPHSVNIPRLRQMEPDLILASSRSRARPRNYFARMTDIAPTLDLGSRTGVDTFINDAIENVLILSAIFDVQDRAFDRIVALKSEMRRVNVLATELNVTTLITNISGNNLSLFGQNSRYGFVHRELGLREAATPLGNTLNLGTYEHGTPAGIELLLDVDADIIFVVDRESLNHVNPDGTLRPTAIDILGHVVFSGMTAIENEHVFFLCPTNWYMVLCGFLSIRYQINEIYEALLVVQASRA